jgi:hypothetical protein
MNGIINNMGYIEIRSRHEDHKIITTSMLADFDDIDSNLAGFLPGDSVIIFLYVDQKRSQQLHSENIPGVKTRENEVRPEDNSRLYVVEIEFKVTGRTHWIGRDWMTKDMGFRLSGTGISIEASTTEGESVFAELQKQFDDQLQKRLFQ